MLSAGTVEHRNTVDHSGPGPKLVDPMAHASIWEGWFLCTQCDDSDQISVKVHSSVPILPYILSALGADLTKDKAQFIKIIGEIRHYVLLLKGC